MRGAPGSGRSKLPNSFPPNSTRSPRIPSVRSRPTWIGPTHSGSRCPTLDPQARASTLPTRSPRRFSTGPWRGGAGRGKSRGRRPYVLWHVGQAVVSLGEETPPRSGASGNCAGRVSAMGALAGDLAQSAKPRDRSQKCSRDLVTGSVGGCPRPTVSASLIRADRPRQRPLASTIGKCSPSTPSAVLLGNGFRRLCGIVQSVQCMPVRIPPQGPVAICDTAQDDRSKSPAAIGKSPPFGVKRRSIRNFSRIRAESPHTAPY